MFGAYAKRYVLLIVQSSNERILTMSILKRFTGFMALLLAMAVVFAGKAHAALVLTGVTFPLADVEAVAALILAAAAGIWVIYKVLTLIRRG